MTKYKLKWLDILASVLLLIGGLNWGLVAFDFNLVDAITNAMMMPFLSKIIYVLVGLSAIEVLVRVSTKKFMK